MSQAAVTLEPREPFKLNVRGIILTDEQFELLCRENPELRLELTAQKELVIMPPTGSESGWRSGEVYFSLTAWSKQDRTGLSFDSSTGFTLPNGAVRSPDASWAKRARWSALTKDQQVKFAPLCPDFVVEVRSPTDKVADLREKMQEYLDNGVQLGWLIDPFEKRIHIYRPGQPVVILDNPTSVSGESVLPGFVLFVRELWS
jgi:Uma2 family endonuclease